MLVVAVNGMKWLRRHDGFHKEVRFDVCFVIGDGFSVGLNDLKQPLLSTAEAVYGFTGGLFTGLGDCLQFPSHVTQLLQNLFPHRRQGVAGFVLGFQAKFNAVLVRAAMLGL